VWIARVWSPWSTYAQLATGHPPMSPGRRGVALASLGGALAALHAAGASHGALSAARVLLSRADGSACEVLDLGVDVIAADLGLTPPGPPRSLEAGAADRDLRGYATIVDQVIDPLSRAGAPWRAALGAWIARAFAGGPSIASALAALRAILPAAEAPEVAPAPPPATAEELARLEAAQLAHSDAARARAEHDDRGQRPRRRTTGLHEPAYVAPIVIGGTAVDPDVWPWLVRARRPAAPFTYDPGRGVMVTGPVTWQLGSGQRTAAADAIADAIARAIDALAGPRGFAELDGALAAVGFTEVVNWAEPPPSPEPRPRGTRWWQGPGMRALVTSQRVTLQRERRRWVTSHHIGTVGEDVVHVATADLPLAPSARAELLAAALTMIALVDQRPAVTHICRFCHGQFDALRFHAQLGACHGCSERHLRIPP
jgi:hypothetical protein